jgi:hypothetical protein
MTDRNNGAGTVESRRRFIIPASKGSIGTNCTAKHADAADCSDKVMAAQWRKRAGRVLFPEVLPVCNGSGRPANARSMGYDHHKG